MTDFLALVPLADLAAFMAAGIVLNLTPGADVMFATACGLSGGPRAGAAAGLGVGLGGLWHVALATLGLGALVAALPGAMLALKWAGAACLLWLAWTSWRAGRADLPPVAPLSPAAAMRRGFLINAFNPKVALFFLAFLPQFTDPGRGPVWVQIALLGAIFTLTGTLITAGYGALAGIARSQLAQRLHILNRIAAGLLALLAVRLLRA